MAKENVARILGAALFLYFASVSVNFDDMVFVGCLAPYARHSHVQCVNGNRIAQNCQAEMVDMLLAAVEGTDRGILATTERKERIACLISQLESAGQGRDFFADGTLYGKYEVVYVGAPSSRIANPAGGRWRGRVGRFFLPTRGIYQHLLCGSDGPLAVNYVELSFLGLFTVMVVLRGPTTKLEPEERSQVANDRNTPGGLSCNSVRASFDPPKIALGLRAPGNLRRWLPLLRLGVGPSSKVVLDAPYVDERIRIGKGASGIRFVFLRTQEAKADAWQRVIERPLVSVRLLGGMLVVAGAAGLGQVAMLGAPLVWTAPWLTVAVLGLAFASSSGGIVRQQPRRADYEGQGLSAARP